MSRLLKAFSIFVVTLFGATLLLVPSVFAEFTDPFQEACSDPGTSADSSVCKDSFDNYNKTADELRADYINKIANIVAAVGGIIAVIMIMVNGLNLLMSTGDTGKVMKAKDGLIYASVGIVIIAMARVIVAFMLRFV